MILPCKAIIFIPDTAGYSFCNIVELKYSQPIFQLLETIFDANQMGLEVSEVAGDASPFLQ